jgi:hypothetical protein
MSKIHIWQEAITEAEGAITIGVTIEDPQQNRTLFWYSLPSKYKELVTNSCDPFVVATILMAMNQSSNLIVHGEVSSSLLRNLTEFQAAWNAWLPNQYSLINIVADVEKEQISNQTSDKAIAAFSGGVDSCFTMFRHRTASCGRWQRNLKAGLMVHGFDIPLQQTEVFENATQRSQKMLSSLGVEMIPIATNFRQVIKVNWEETYATAVASCMLLLQRGFNAGLLPSSSRPYNELSFPHGSNPITDNLISSNNFQTIHDGAAFSRIEKIREIANWPEALQYLRVCWQGSQKDRNCCRCEKCIRTILNFRLLRIDLPSCFEQDVTNQQILNIKVKGTQIEELERAVQAAKALDISDSWVMSTKIAIKRNKIQNSIKDSLPSAVRERWRKIRNGISKS